MFNRKYGTACLSHLASPREFGSLKAIYIVLNVNTLQYLRNELDFWKVHGLMNFQST